MTDRRESKISTRENVGSRIRNDAIVHSACSYEVLLHALEGRRTITSFLVELQGGVNAAQARGIRLTAQHYSHTLYPDCTSSCFEMR